MTKLNCTQLPSNVIGNKTVNQRGKYNINIDRATGINIGDTYGLDDRSDRIDRGWKTPDPSTEYQSDSINPKTKQSENDSGQLWRLIES